MSGETSDAWPHVVAVSSDGRHRIILSGDSPPAVQWIFQKRVGEGGRWVSTNFNQSKEGLTRHAAVDPLLVAAVAELPARCPQQCAGAAGAQKAAAVPPEPTWGYCTPKAPFSKAMEANAETAL